MKDEDKAKLKRFVPFLLVDSIICIGSLLLALYLIANKVYLINIVFSIVFIISSFGLGLIITADGIIFNGKIGNWFKNGLIGLIFIGGIFHLILLLEIFVPNFIFQLPQWSWFSVEYTYYDFMLFLSTLIVFGVGSFSICLGKIFQMIFVKKANIIKKRERKFCKNIKIRILGILP